MINHYVYISVLVFLFTPMTSLD